MSASVKDPVLDAEIDGLPDVEVQALYGKEGVRLDRAEGEVESYDVGQGKSLAEEIAELEVEDAIDRELEELRSGLAAQTSHRRS